MHRFHQTFTALIILFLLLGLGLPAVNAAASNGGQISLRPSQVSTDNPSQSGETVPAASLLAADGSGVDFVLETSWQDLLLEPVEVDGKSYVRVSFAGWASLSSEGKPALPVYVEQIGVPFGAEVTVEVTPGPAHRIALEVPVVPAATKVINEEQPLDAAADGNLPAYKDLLLEDADVYGGWGIYPGRLAEISGDFILRQQRIVGVSAYPVQYDVSAGELVVYETLNVHVGFTGGTAARRSLLKDSAAYEELLQGELLNYGQALSFRSAERTAPPATDDAAPMDALLNGGTSDWTPPDPGWRVRVKADGMYRLTYEELATAGVPVDSLESSTLQLFNRGQEVALREELGADGIWNAGDYLVFYGQALDTKYTAENIYWLTYGKAAGLRMALVDGTPLDGTVPAAFQKRLHLEESTMYLTEINDMGEREHFVMARLYPPKYLTTWTYSFTLPNPASSPAVLRIAFYGGTDPAADPDHHVQVTLNGGLADVPEANILFNGRNWYIAEIPVPAGLLRAAPDVNVLSVIDLLDLGFSTDIVYIDWVEMDYQYYRISQADKLQFTAPAAGSWRFPVSGFSTSGVWGYDLTTPSAPLIITGVAISGSGPYTAEFEASSNSRAEYWLGTDAALSSVAGIEADTASLWRSSAQGADYILFTPAAFMAPARTLRDYRQAQGLRAVAVDIQDVYDEFNYGIIAPEAIHSFLAYAYASWTAPAPSYVVLLGDGNFDPKNYLNLNKTSFIPPYLADADPWMMETAADNRYVTLAGEDTVPDMMLGRFAVNSLAEAQTMVGKAIAYEESPQDGDWQQQLLAVTDNNDSGGMFTTISDGLISCCVPAPYTTEKIYYGVDPYPIGSNPNPAIIAGYGKFLINYIGHGSSGSWAGTPTLLANTDISKLTNGAWQPIVLAMTCMEGYFINPDSRYESLAETFTRAANKGAVASWSAAGLGLATGHDFLNRGFLNALLRDGVASIGEATMAGKLNLASVGTSPDLLDTYLLFGDPALRTVATAINFESVTPETSDVNQPYSVTVRATSSLAIPTGNVTIDDGTAANCVAALDAAGYGTCDLTSITPGIKTLTATYLGDALVNGIVRKTTHVVAAQSTTTILAHTPEPSFSYSPYQVSVSVSGGWGNPTGQVTVSDDLGATCSFTLAQGTGYCSLISTQPGTRTITAMYAGDSNYRTSQAVTTHEVTPTYNISGIILDTDGAPLESVSLTDGAGHTVVTNSAGIYTFAHLPAGDYLITPARFGYTFDPLDQRIHLVDADAGSTNFTATQLKYTISGRVVNYLGEPMKGVAVGDDLGHTTLTDINGDYTLEGYPYGYYIITPSRLGYYFTPAYEPVTVLDQPRTGIDFIGTPDGTLFSVSGVIKDAADSPVQDVAVTDGSGQTVMTDENGEYTLMDLPAGNYTITPEKSGFVFDPVSQLVTINTSHITGINFLAQKVYTLSGTILDEANVPVQGVNVADDLGQVVQTDELGQYTLIDLLPGMYTVTPSKLGYRFTPESAEVTITSENLTGQDFSAILYAVPKLISPPIGAKTNQAEVELRWKAVKDSASYKVVVARDALFLNKVFKTRVYPVGGELELSFTLPELADGKYFWHVTAINAEDVRSAWSETWRFRIDTVPPARPLQLKPQNLKQLTTSQPILRIYAAEGASTYHYQVASDIDFVNIVIESDNSAGLTWTVPVPLTEGVYYWRVKAIDEATNESVWSKKWQFEIVSP